MNSTRSNPLKHSRSHSRGHSCPPSWKRWIMRMVMKARMEMK
nr:hypothetical protein I308_01397 [Cryptococcus tetragattii IND107]